MQHWSLARRHGPGSLKLADLGYFSFPWFDSLTGQGYWWVSRLKERVSYELKEVVAYDNHTGLLDAIVWLGTYRAELVLIQLWIAFILAQLLHALQLHVALQAEVEPCNVSMYLLVEVLDTMPVGPTPIIERLVQGGRPLGLIRPSTRLHVVSALSSPNLSRPDAPCSLCSRIPISGPLLSFLVFILNF